MSTTTVLVTGANGYIGRAVAVAYRAQGFKVYGLVRSEEKAKDARLLQEEVIPVIGEGAKPDGFKDILKECGMVIECSTLTESREILENLLKATIASGPCEDGTKKIFVYTTGFKQRAHEPYLLENKDVIGVVVRPSFIYGGNGGPVFKYLFFKKIEGTLSIGGNPKKHFPWCHITDLAK